VLTSAGRSDARDTSVADVLAVTAEVLGVCKMLFINSSISFLATVASETHCNKQNRVQDYIQPTFFIPQAKKERVL
jgi:hypothetical protein